MNLQTTVRRKGDKRERTSAALIRAAAEVIGERGYERTTLEEVAARAGMTRGAIYGNFRDREDLFLSVVTSLWQPIIPRYEPGRPLQDQLRLLGEAVVAAADDRRGRAVGALSFQIYALTHEEIRLRLAHENAAIYGSAAKALTDLVAADSLPMPAERFVRALHALIEGLLLLRFLTPELITDEVILSAFAAFGDCSATASPSQGASNAGAERPDAPRSSRGSRLRGPRP